MNEQHPVDILPIESKENNNGKLRIFSVPQVLKSLVGYENGPYTPINEIQNPAEIRRRKHQLNYFKGYLEGLNKPNVDHNDIIAKLDNTKQEIQTKIKPMDGKEIVDELGKLPQQHKEDTPLHLKSVSTLGTDLMVLESLKNIPNSELSNQIGELIENITSVRHLLYLENKIPIGNDNSIGQLNGQTVVLNKIGGMRKEVLGKYEDFTIDNTKICLTTGEIFGSGGVPRGTRLLILGPKFVKSAENPDHEVQQGYRQGESLKMILIHEFTHNRFIALPSNEKTRLLDYFASRWGDIFPFAQLMMSRDHYRDAAMNETTHDLNDNPSIKTRPFTINGVVYEISVEAVIQELIAFNSTNLLLGKDRVKTLANINPTQEDSCREMLSVKAGEVFDRLDAKVVDNLIKPIYSNIATNSELLLQKAFSVIK